MERGEFEGWGLRPRPHGFVFPNPDPPCMMGKIFLPHPCPLGPREDSAHPVKLYFLLIFLQLLQLFLINLFR